MASAGKEEKLARPEEGIIIGKRQSRSVAFDSNMLLNIARFRVDIFMEARKLLGDVEFILPTQVMDELEMLSSRGLRLAKEVKVAKELMAKNNVKTVEITAKNADEALKSLAGSAIIGTNDKELKDSVKELNGKTLYLRQRKFLELG